MFAVKTKFVDRFVNICQGSVLGFFTNLRAVVGFQRLHSSFSVLTSRLR